MYTNFIVLIYFLDFFSVKFRTISSNKTKVLMYRKIIFKFQQFLIRFEIQ